MIGDKSMPSWRDELTCTSVYKKIFAWWPKKIDGRTIWWKYFYRKYKVWGIEFGEAGHWDLVEEITEDVYLVRKLSEKL